MQIKQALAALILVTLIAVNCNRNKSELAFRTEGADTFVSLALTSKQIKKFNLETIKIDRQLIDRNFECVGMLDLFPSDYASVTVPVGGTLSALYIKNGDYVRSGTLLADLEHPDYLTIQQEYLEIKNQLKYYQEEFKRQGELTIEDASSIKRMQQAEMDYRTSEVSVAALKEKLRFIGIDADSLHIENITPTIRLYAPISGFISMVKVVQGSYISPGQPVCELVNPQNPHILLQVSEQYAAKVKPGQPVSFAFPGDDPARYSATIQTTGFRIDPISKTLELVAFMHFPAPSGLPGMTVHAKVDIDPDSAYVIPSQAIVSSQTGKYIIMHEEGAITRIRVVTGAVHHEMTEIKNMNTALLNKDFVISGAGALNLLFEDP